MNIKPDKIIRTNRKTISLQITQDAKLVVRVPNLLTDKELDKILIKHKNWIERKIKKMQERIDLRTKKEFVNGEGFLYLGKFYKLHIVEAQARSLIFDGGFYLSKNYLPKAREEFVKWYKKKAHEVIPQRVEFYARMYGYSYNKVRITRAQKRLGSCSYKGNLNFSWRLIMAPIEVIDYVVVHELAHLEVRNHSKRFWSKVKLMMPDYKQRVGWLKRNNHLLIL